MILKDMDPQLQTSVPSEEPQYHLSKYLLPVFLSLLVGVLLGFFGKDFLMKPVATLLKTQSYVLTPTPTIKVQDTSSNTDTITSVNKGVSLYTSSQLGVRFEFPSNLTPTRIGNKIYLNYSLPYGQPSGNYVQVFQKPKNEDLKGIISNLMYSCPEDEYKVAYYPQTFQHPLDANLIVLSASVTSKTFDATTGFLDIKCHSPFLTYDSRTYFLEDKRHPDRFLYVDTGQNSLEVNGKNWDETIEVLYFRKLM